MNRNGSNLHSNGKIKETPTNPLAVRITVRISTGQIVEQFTTGYPYHNVLDYARKVTLCYDNPTIRIAAL
jgi:hypothetical protein